MDSGIDYSGGEWGIGKKRGERRGEERDEVAFVVAVFYCATTIWQGR
jgi:hypothetical protein